MKKVKIQLEEALGRAREIQKELQKIEDADARNGDTLQQVQEKASEFLHSFEGPAYLQSRLQRFISISHRLNEKFKEEQILKRSMLRQLEKFLDPDLLQYYSPAVSRRVEHTFSRGPELRAPSASEHRCYRLGEFFYVTRAEPLLRISAQRLRKPGLKIPRRVVTPDHGSVSLFPGHPEHYRADGPTAVQLLQGSQIIGLWIDEELPPLDIRPYMEEMEVSRRAPYPVAGRFRRKGIQHYLLEI